MNKHTATAIQPSLDEGVGLRKILKEILIVDVIHMNGQMLVRFEELLLRVYPKNRENVSDVRLL